MAELKLIHSPLRHLGTERSLAVLKNMQDFLTDKITILYDDAVDKLIVENEQAKGFTTKSGHRAGLQTSLHRIQCP